jgi:hypothetical protein
VKLSPSQIRNALFVLSLGIAFALYGALRLTHVQNTAGLYVGLPLLLAVFVSLIETENIMATAMKVLTIALLLSPILVGEGFICVIMASPILFAVTFLVVVLIRLIRKGINDDETPFKSSTALFLMFLLSLEGTTPATTLDRHNQVSVERVVPLSVAEVKQALAATPKFDKRPDGFLTWLFQPPSKVIGSGLSVGDRRTITMTYNKWIVTNAWVGDEIFEVAKSGKDSVTFKLVEDKSYMDLYLQWQEASAQWQEVDAHHTKVKVTIDYLRKLDPSWYFGPMERSAVTDAAQTMLDSL